MAKKRSGSRSIFGPSVVVLGLLAVICIVVVVFYRLGFDRTDSKLDKILARVSTSKQELSESAQQVKDIKIQLAAANLSDERIKQLENEKEKAIFRVRELAAQLGQLVEEVEASGDKTPTSKARLNEAKTSLRGFEVDADLHVLVDFTAHAGPPPGEYWNYSPDGQPSPNEVETDMVRNPTVGMQLRYKLEKDFSGWTLRLHGQNWTVYKNWSVVIRFLKPTSCPDFKFDLNTASHAQPGFSAQNSFTPQMREQLQRQGYTEVKIPLQRLLYDGRIAVTEGDHLSNVKDLALVFEHDHTQNGELLLHSIRMEAASAPLGN